MSTAVSVHQVHSFRMQAACTAYPSAYTRTRTARAPVQVTSWDLLVALSLTLLAVGWFFYTRPPAGAMNSFFPRGSMGGERGITVHGDSAGETSTCTASPRGLTPNRASYHAPTPTKALTNPSSGEVERTQVAALPFAHHLVSFRRAGTRVRT